MKRASLLIFAAFISVPLTPAHSGTESGMNALLVINSGTEAFDKDFQKYLADNGARILRAFPPHAFIGYVPAALDKPLADRFGVEVYRSRIDDLTPLARYGGEVFRAVNEWNKHLQEDPPEAPLVISHKVFRAKEGTAIVLSWNEVMKAVEYRLEIARDEGFGDIVFKTFPTANRYELYPAFFEDGVYYWRVAGILVLNMGEKVESRFSETFSFPVSRPAGAAAVPAPRLPKSMAVKGGRPLAWQTGPAFRYYRVQLAGTAKFSDLLVDDFTDKNSYPTSGLQLESGAAYYLRLMGASDSAAGPWSAPCKVRIDGPGDAGKEAEKQ